MEVNCPYCDKQAMLVPGFKVYPHRSDLKDKSFWVCDLCDARVGCQPNGKPFGPLANRELRQLRMEAHRAFDPLWKRGGYTRGSAYRWLSKQLEVNEVHIGSSDEETCRIIISTCLGKK